MNNKKITIVIATYNSRLKLPDCLESIYRQTYNQDLIKVIVIDNNSSDSTVGFVAENYPKVKVIKNRQNRGFATANNQGYFLAQKSGADYLFLANDDIVLAPDCLAKLVTTIESEKGIAAVQAKLLLHPEMDKINSLGNSFHYLGFGFCNHYREKDNPLLFENFAVPYPSGAAVLLKMSALEQVGLFDDKLFMYHEDADLGWRLRLTGKKVLLNPSAVAWHKYNYSKAKYKMYYMERNRWVVMLQNYRLLTILVLLPILLVMEAGMIVFSIKNGWFKEKMKSWFWVVAHLPSIVTTRINTQFNIRKVKDKEIIKLFVSEIKFQEIDNPLLNYVANPVMRVYWWVVRRIIFW